MLAQISLQGYIPSVVIQSRVGKALSVTSDGPTWEFPKIGDPRLI